MKVIAVPTAESIICINKFICEEGGNKHHCYGIGKIESALHSAFYPGSYPFEAGDLVHVAATLCFYMIKSHAFVDGNKRTAVLVAITFLNRNGIDLEYSINRENALAKIIDDCAAGKVTKEKLMTWFDKHKSILK